MPPTSLAPLRVLFYFFHISHDDDFVSPVPETRSLNHFFPFLSIIGENDTGFSNKSIAFDIRSSRELGGEGDPETRLIYQRAIIGRGDK